MVALNLQLTNGWMTQIVDLCFAKVQLEIILFLTDKRYISYVVKAIYASEKVYKLQDTFQIHTAYFTLNTDIQHSNPDL